ncbi:MAG: oxygenase MpaB family protein, partial [Candidatus Binatia bacterium]
MAWKIHREIVLLLGWGRAILLQFAHPLVAQGVAEHSVFVSQPAARLDRLRSTIDSMLALTFGDAAESARALGRINAIHDRVHGELQFSAGAFAKGTVYSARDAELLKWVHATLLDSFILTYERCVGLLSTEEKDAYCFESAGIEQLLGIPAGYLPRSLSELHQY